MLRRTKIVATIGPATRARPQLESLVRAGVDVARCNFAHATEQTHRATVLELREVAESVGRTVGLLVDLPGPKMRTGPVEDDEIELEAGRPFVLVGDDVTGNAERVSTTVSDLPQLVAPGEEVYLADGEIVLKVQDVRGPDVHTEVMRGGILRSRKGMHVPEAERSLEAFTPDDRRALEAALALRADLVGLSFVRDAEDLSRVRAALPRRGPRPMLVAKIETRGALDHLEEIVAASDAVMVARGDLGIQTPLNRVPLLQKEIIRACNRRGVPVITATQMLESMTHDPLPTRAEVADVANAVIDGTDALMLSEETAVGDHPTETVETMASIAVEAERESHDRNVPRDIGGHGDRVSWAVAHAAVEAAEDLGVAAILCATHSGSTARRVTAFRPTMQVVGISPRADTLGGLALSWGVLPLGTEELPEAATVRDEVERAVGAARAAGITGPGDLVAVVAGSPGPRAGRTDFLHIVRC